jgi:sulfopyruvate decarboxylase subunit beta
MNRYDCMIALADMLDGDELVIVSLGASVDEWYNAAPHLRAGSLFQQQLGCVTPEAFGLAVGLPHRRVISLDTDGGLLFNLGILATLGNEQPPNLLIVVWDNECYQSIGGPPTHRVRAGRPRRDRPRRGGRRRVHGADHRGVRRALRQGAAG